MDTVSGGRSAAAGVGGIFPSPGSLDHARAEETAGEAGCSPLSSGGTPSCYV